MTERIPTLGGDAARLVAYLRRGGNYGYFWSATQQKDSTGKEAVWKCTHWRNGTGSDALPIDQHPQYGACNLYFSVNPVHNIPQRFSGKRRVHDGNVRAKVEEISAINCLYAEYDQSQPRFNGSKEAILAHVETLPALPSNVIDSGGGYHCYWLLDEPFILDTSEKRAHAADIQKRWVDLVGGDDGAKDLARVLRIPNTLNYKYDPPRAVTFVRAEFDRLYTLDTLEGELPPPEAPKRTKKQTADLTGNARRAARALRRLSKTRCDDYGKWINVGMALAELGDAGLDLWIDWSKQSDKFDEDACRAKWETFSTDENKLTLASLFYWANEDDPDPRPRIQVRDLDIPKIVSPAWDALIAANNPPALFRRDNVLYELEKDDTGALVMTEVDKRRLRGRLARVAVFEESREKRGDLVSWIVEPPSPILDDMLTKIDPRVPVLTRVTRCPIVAADGRIIDQQGYHAAARIYYDPRPDVTIPQVADQPSADDVKTALDLIRDELLVNFPFAAEADKAHAIALFLLPFCRELIDGPTPLHLIEAPVMGSGKSLLARALLFPALGRAPASFTEGENEAEWRKRLTSILGTTPATFFIDNINRELAGGQLAAALTETTWSDRLLGTNHTMAAPIRCVWLATANNPTMSGEIARRCIRIRINPKVDRPWKREDFKHTNLVEWVAANQGRLIAAALTIIRYGLAHGEKPTKTLGSFEHWAATLGRILSAADIPDFLGNLDELYDRADSEGAAWRELVIAWWGKHKGEIVGSGVVFELFKSGEYDLGLNAKDERGLKAAFGRRLAKQRDRVIGEYQVVWAAEVNRAQQWKLKPVSSGMPADGGTWEYDVPPDF